MSEKFKIHGHFYEDELPINTNDNEEMDEFQKFIETFGFTLHYSYNEYSEFYIVEYESSC